MVVKQQKSKNMSYIFFVALWFLLKIHYHSNQSEDKNMSDNYPMCYIYTPLPTVHWNKFKYKPILLIICVVQKAVVTYISSDISIQFPSKELVNTKYKGSLINTS